LPDLSGKPTPGLQNLNPYLGGNETASVNLKGNTDNPLGIPGSGDVKGPGGGPIGNGGTGEEGEGTKGGNPGTSEIEGSGYFDASGYIASLEANKVMPQQAVRRGITGAVHLMVHFDGEGNFVDAEITQSSGSSILDNAAYSLAASSGGAVNTTGEPKSEPVIITYNLE